MAEREALRARVAGLDAPTLNRVARVTLEISDRDFEAFRWALGAEVVFTMEALGADIAINCEVVPRHGGGQPRRVVGGPFVIDGRTCWKLEGMEGIWDGVLLLRWRQ